MDVIGTYKSIAAASEGLYKDKGSKFIAYAYPVTSEEQIKALVDALGKEHHAARHCCFAWRLGGEKLFWRANDDGEPSGSAGRPILGAIDAAGVSDVLVVVVRYFGGILLGVPGLVRAYREAAADALGKAGVMEKVVCEAFVLEFDYADSGDVEKLVGMQGVRVLERRFEQKCSLTVEVPVTIKEVFEGNIKLNNNEKSTRIQCRSLQITPGSN